MVTRMDQMNEMSDQDAERRKTRRSAIVLTLAMGLFTACGSPAGGTTEKGHGSGEKTEGGHDHDHGGEEHEHEGEHAEEAKLSAEAVKRNGVRVESVKRRALRPALSTAAVVSFNAERTAHVGSPLSGRVSEIRVRPGDTVAKGDTLLVIQSSELGAAQGDYLQKRATTVASAPIVELSKKALQRAESLYKSQAISLSEVQKREIEYKTALAVYVTARSQAAADETKLRLLGMDQAAIDELVKGGKIDPRYALRAPISGKVIERKATLGELVEPQEESILVLSDLSTLWILADVPEARMGEVRVGSKARIAAPGNNSIEGLVSYLSATIDPTTRTVQARIEVTGAEVLRPGTFVRSELELSGPDEGKDAVLSIPEVALQIVEGKPSVFVPVPGEENTFAKRPVNVGRAVAGLLPVISGLEEGELVVVDGSFILKAELGKAGAEHDH